MGKPTMWFPTRSDTNRAVQSQKTARSMICALVFAYANCWFSHEVAHISITSGWIHCFFFFFFLLLFFFLNTVLRHFQDYFSLYETGQSVGGRKRENPEKKPPGTPASRTWLSLMLPVMGSNPGPEVIKLFSCSSLLRLKFILLINVKMPTIVGILTFMSRINY